MKKAFTIILLILLLGISVLVTLVIKNGAGFLATPSTIEQSEQSTTLTDLTLTDISASDLISESDVISPADIVSVSDIVSEADIVEVEVTPTDTEPELVCVTSDPNKNAPGVKYMDYSLDYHVVVYLKSQKVVVYAKNETGKYNLVYKCFSCSSGAKDSPTRTGYYKIRKKYLWRALVGNTFGHYNCSISSDYLFHSVPYTKNEDPSSLKPGEFEKLGTQASHGCIRLCVRDARWMYLNLPIGTVVNIVNMSSNAEPIPIPEVNPDPLYKGWDPSDEWSEGNPYYSD